MQTIAVYGRNELKKLKIALYFAVKNSIICFERKIVYCLTIDIRRIRLKSKKIPEVGSTVFIWRKHVCARRNLKDVITSAGNDA